MNSSDDVDATLLTGCNLEAMSLAKVRVTVAMFTEFSMWNLGYWQHASSARKVGSLYNENPNLMRFSRRTCSTIYRWLASKTSFHQGRLPETPINGSPRSPLTFVCLCCLVARCCCWHTQQDYGLPVVPLPADDPLVDSELQPAHQHALVLIEPLPR